MFCILRYDLAGENPDTLPQLEEEVGVREAACLRYPAREFQYFDPYMAFFSREPTAVGSYVSLPEAFPPENWTQLAIQVRSDGDAFLIVKGRIVADLSVKLRGTERTDWRIVLGGHSVDTRLEVRNVTVWRGQRF